MADRLPMVTLGRAAPEVTEINRPGLVLKVEGGVGIGKVQIFGADADTAFHRVTGRAAPQPREQSEAGGLTVAWLAPGEWLLTGPEPKVTAWLARIDAIATDEVLAVDLTHARVSFLIEGTEARTALASHCPLDLWDKAFCEGAVARSLLGDTAMFIARLEDVPTGPSFRIIVDQTMAAYAARMLAGPPRSRSF